jgi:high-affinity Fe2+/Pb2+ permease
MAVPAAIVTGIGLLLYWQNATGNWESWAYVWALIPGFAGVGVLFAGLLGETPRQSLRDGVNLIIISLIMFVIAAAFLGGPNLLGPYWPVLIILFGVWLLIRPLWRAQR